MFLIALAAAASAAATPPPDILPPKTVSPLTVTPQPKEEPPVDASVALSSNETDLDSQGATIFPTHAWYRGASGRAVITCLIDVHGLAERCRVAWQEPQGQGFGAAALEQQPLLHITPKKGQDGEPVAAEMNIAITFKPPMKRDEISAELRKHTGNLIPGQKIEVTSQPRAMREIVMLNHPVWGSAPSFDDLATVAPKSANGAEGYVVLHCDVARRSGKLGHCFAAQESATGFGAAALMLAAKFRVSPESVQGAPHSGPLEIDVPIRFPSAQELAERRVSAPSWLLALDPNKTPKLFPPQAADNGITTGRGVARCTVTAEGALSACRPEPGDPDGVGFSQAAVKLASMLKINLWGADAAPVEGGVIDVPIRLNLKTARR